MSDENKKSDICKSDNLHLGSYYIGIAIVFISHIYMLIKIDKMDKKEVNTHSIINLIGAIMIAYYFMNKEGHISF